MEKIRQLTGREFKSQLVLSGISTKELSEEAGVSCAHVYNWISGHANISSELYNKLVDAFNKIRGSR